MLLKFVNSSHLTSVKTKWKNFSTKPKDKLNLHCLGFLVKEKSQQRTNKKYKNNHNLIRSILSIIESDNKFSRKNQK